MATERLTEDKKQEALNNLTRHYPRFSDGSLMPLTEKEKEEIDTQRYFIEHHGHTVTFDGNGGWYFEDTDWRNWDPTV